MPEINWETISVIFPIRRRWQFTASMSGSYFRLQQLGTIDGLELRICQFDGISFYEHNRVEPSPYKQIIYLPTDTALMPFTRRIGLRASTDHEGWQVRLERQV